MECRLKVILKEKGKSTHQFAELGIERPVEVPGGIERVGESVQEAESSEQVRKLETASYVLENAELKRVHYLSKQALKTGEVESKRRKRQESPV